MMGSQQHTNNTMRMILRMILRMTLRMLSHRTTTRTRTTKTRTRTTKHSPTRGIHYHSRNSNTGSCLGSMPPSWRTIFPTPNSKRSSSIFHTGGERPTPSATGNSWTIFWAVLRRCWTIEQQQQQHRQQQRQHRHRQQQMAAKSSFPSARDREAFPHRPPRNGNRAGSCPNTPRNTACCCETCSRTNRPTNKPPTGARTGRG
mmetsp:Transcript_6508/g.18668  ORF Transcript_6508/g.18668 Transcript_6508/m.18668 type:complete len:202 (-) Transcript_6508:167-772(-)